MDLHPSWSSFSEWQILKSGSSMINYSTKIVLSHLIKKKSNENQMNPNQINIWLWQDVQLCLNKWNKHDNNNNKKPRAKEINHQK